MRKLAYLAGAIALATDREHDRSGVLPRVSDTIVSVQLGEAVAVAQDRPVIATVSGRRRSATVGAAHAECRIGAQPYPGGSLLGRVPIVRFMRGRG